MHIRESFKERRVHLIEARLSALTFPQTQIDCLNCWVCPFKQSTWSWFFRRHHSGPHWTRK